MKVNVKTKAMKVIFKTRTKKKVVKTGARAEDECNED